ncbi:hypothetical protein KFE25_006714 [Diacronema lutheri]|uniref:Uncharacterized protein n=2 Tax=Diacronema lutheri TaxID=2081491 RepID=A0A8J6CAH8_DIALT|nr:hypothetical protein KFE25_006714 [Diacronema lutheri]
MPTRDGVAAAAQGCGARSDVGRGGGAHAAAASSTPPPPTAPRSARTTPATTPASSGARAVGAGASSSAAPERARPPDGMNLVALGANGKRPADNADALDHPRAKHGKFVESICERFETARAAYGVPTSGFTEDNGAVTLHGQTCIIHRPALDRSIFAFNVVPRSKSAKQLVDRLASLFASGHAQLISAEQGPVSQFVLNQENTIALPFVHVGDVANARRLFPPFAQTGQTEQRLESDGGDGDDDYDVCDKCGQELLNDVCTGPCDDGLYEGEPSSIGAPATLPRTPGVVAPTCIAEAAQPASAAADSAMPRVKANYAVPAHSVPLQTAVLATVDPDAHRTAAVAHRADDGRGAAAARAETANAAHTSHTAAPAAYMTNECARKALELTCAQLVMHEFEVGTFHDLTSSAPKAKRVLDWSEEEIKRMRTTHGDKQSVFLAKRRTIYWYLKYSGAVSDLGNVRLGIKQLYDAATKEQKLNWTCKAANSRIHWGDVLKAASSHEPLLVKNAVPV